MAARAEELLVTNTTDLADRIVVMGTKPGCIREVLDIDFERPRDIGKAQLIELEKVIRRQVREETAKVGIW